MLRPIQLVVLHRERDKAFVLSDTCDEVSEILLQLVIRQVDLEQVVVLSYDLLTNYHC